MDWLLGGPEWHFIVSGHTFLIVYTQAVWVGIVALLGGYVGGRLYR